MELKDASDLMRVIFNRVDVILFGHKHVSKKWEKSGGFNYILASDDSPGKNFAREITIEKGSVSTADLAIA